MIAQALARVIGAGAQGDLSQTGNNLDVAIQGQGFFEVQMPDGTLAYTRDGSFKSDSQGRIVTNDKTANCGWGDDGTVLYLCTNDKLTRVRTSTKGLGW